MKLLRIVIVAGLTLGLLALWLRSIDLAAVAASLRAADPAWIAVAAGFSVLHLVVRSWRWRFIVGDVGAARLGDLVRYTFIGYAVTFVIPGRAGEIVRPALLWRRAGVPFGRALGSIVLERILDVVALGACLLAFLLIEPDKAPAALRWAVAVLLGAGISVLLVLSVFARRHRVLADRLVAALTGRLPAKFGVPAARFAASLLDGLDGIFRAGNVPLVLAASLLTWLPVTLTSWAGLQATGVVTPWSAPLALVPLTAVGIAVPTPAGVGGFHAAATWGLQHLFGADPARAAAAAVVTHAASVLPIIALGLYASWREGLSLSALRRETGAAPQETASP